MPRKLYEKEIAEFEARSPVASCAIAPKEFGQILDQVNSLRIALGIGEGKLEEFPKGAPGDATMCVLAQALSNGWEPEVDNAFIYLTHWPTDGINFAKLATALRRRGFEDVRFTDYSNTTEDPEFANGIRFKTPPLWSRLITEFDRENIPWLISDDFLSEIEA